MEKEVIKQKVEGKKMMGWDKIHQFLCCKCCEKGKKSSDTINTRPPYVAQLYCEKCYFNLSGDSQLVKKTDGFGVYSTYENKSVILTPRQTLEKLFDNIAEILEDSNDEDDF